MVDPPSPDSLYRHAGATVDERVADLLGQMTVEEKVAQLTSIWLMVDPDSGEVAPSQMTFGVSPDYDDPWTAMAHGMGQITRPLGSQPVEPRVGAANINRIQHHLVDQTRLGIPAICHEECLTGLMAQGMTSFPSPLNFGATWDPDLIERIGDTIRRQMRSVGTHQGLAPVADVSRDARWGRVEETQGEDPYLVGTMVSAYVRGLQGDDISEGVIATLKHFVAYSFSEGGRNFAPAHVGPRELRDVFLLPFEMAIRTAGCRSVMNAYQEIDGSPPAAARWLLTDILRGDWGFEGFVVADYGAVSFLYLQHHLAEGSTDASALALRAGLDVELPNCTDYPAGLPAALDQGLISMDDLDLAVVRVLRQKFELGLFDDPYVDVDAIELDTAQDRALAAEVARQSMILLANDGALPLAAEPGHIAVLGPNADEAMALFGNYSFENHLVSTHFPDAASVITAPTLLDRLVERLGEDLVSHSRGCEIMSSETDGIAEAADLAAGADIAIVVVGDKAGHFRQGTVGEGTDTADLSLPGGQHALVDAVIATGTPTVVVLLNGRPFALGDLVGRAAAIVEAWFPGQDGAGAIVDVLFGDVNPGGRTTVSFAQTAGAQPVYYNRRRLAVGLPALPDYEPVFPFGHGLSYTEFDYTDLELAGDEVPVDATIGVSCTVTNTGDRAGDEIVQLYARDPLASVTRPQRELKGFHRLRLEPGQAARVSFSVPTDVLAFTGMDLRRIVEPGQIDLALAASSEDLRLKASVTLTGPTRELGPDPQLLTTATHSLLTAPG
jgi:beta-glucosidase-like glycosyl hydrolase